MTENQHSIPSQAPLGGVALAEWEMELAESVRSDSAPEPPPQQITFMSTFPNAVSTGRLTGELSDAGSPLWLQGTHWTPLGGPGVLIDDLDCNCANPTTELPDLAQTDPPCEPDRASAFRMAVQGFDKTCVVDGAHIPRAKLQRQTSLAMGNRLARSMIAAAKAQGFEADGTTRAKDEQGTDLPLGDVTLGKEICVHKALGVLTSHREHRSDGTFGSLVASSMLKYYMVEHGYVRRVGNRWETPDREPTFFAPTNAMTGPNGETGLWLYAGNGVDWVLTDIDDLAARPTREQARGNRNPEPHAQRFGMIRHDRPNTFGAAVVAGCNECEGDL